MLYNYVLRIGKYVKWERDTCASVPVGTGHVSELHIVHGNDVIFIFDLDAIL